MENKTMSLSSKIVLAGSIILLIAFVKLAVNNPASDPAENNPTSTGANVLVCPEYLFSKYQEDCINHTNDWYPGKLVEDGSRQELPEVSGEDSHSRFKSIAQSYGLDASLIREVETKYNLREGILLAIAVAETSGGTAGYGKCNNILNNGNNDRGDRYCYDSIREGLEKGAKTLNNKYLKDIKTVGCLSNWHHCSYLDDNGHRYATSSPETSGAWEPNVMAVLRAIYGEDIKPESFSIRREFLVLE